MVKPTIGHRSPYNCNWLIPGNHIRLLGMAKRFEGAQQKYCFEKICFPLAISAVNNVETTAKGKFCPFDVAEGIECDVG
jgi:hypothetical protein